MLKSQILFKHLKLTGLWQDENFRNLWLGQTISLFGSAVTSLALPLTAALNLQATSAQMGFLRAAQFAPFLLIGLLVGVWVDRLPRRPILIGANLGSALLLSLIPITAVLGHLHIEYLYCVAFGVGSLNVFFNTAYFALLPTLVQREQLVEGNSKLQVSLSSAQIMGPGLGGALVQWFTAPLAIVLDALSFLFSARLFALIQTPEPVQIQSSLQSNLWHEMGEGLQVVLRNPLLRSLAICASTTRMFISLVESVYILYVTRELRITPIALGIIQTIGAFGALLGALFAQRSARWFGLGSTLVSSSFLWGIGYLFIALANGQLIVTFLLLILAEFLSGMGAIVYDITQISLRQALLPDRLQGRMNASIRFMIWSLVPVGALLGGRLGDTIGLRASLWVGALGTSVAFLWVFFSPVRVLYEPPVPEVLSTCTSTQSFIDRS